MILMKLAGADEPYAGIATYPHYYYHYSYNYYHYSYYYPYYYYVASGNIPYSAERHTKPVICKRHPRLKCVVCLLNPSRLRLYKNTAGRRTR